MIRERMLRIVLVVVGLLFLAAVLPTVGGVLHPDQSDTGDTMMMSIYATLGLFLLLAARNPSANRTLIMFTAWSGFAHAVVMSLLGFKMPDQRNGFLVGSAILVVVGVLLISFVPPRVSGGASTTRA